LPAAVFGPVERWAEEVRRWLAEAEATAQRLEAVLHAGKKKGTVDMAEAEKAFKGTAAACTRCHARYRDMPQGP
jgi:cytochrome c556